MKIWNKSRIYIYILAIILFFFITYKFYKSEQESKYSFDKEYISFLTDQIKGNINDKLQLPSNILKYIVNLQYFKKLAVFDSTGKELFSMAKGAVGVDTATINKLIAIPMSKDTILIIDKSYVKIIQIRSILNNNLIGKSVLVIKPHFRESYFTFIKKQGFTIIALILILILLLIKFPQKSSSQVNKIELVKDMEQELVNIPKPEKYEDKKEIVKSSEFSDRYNATLLKLKERIFDRLKSINLMETERYIGEGTGYNIDIEKNIESIMRGTAVLKEDINKLKIGNTADSENLMDFIANFKNELEKVEYFANRLRILSYNAMILANSAGIEGEGFKVVADEMVNLSDRIFQFHNTIKNNIEEFKIDDKNLFMEDVSSNISRLINDVDLLNEKKENEDKRLNKEIPRIINSHIKELESKYKTILKDFGNYLENLFANLNS